MKHSRRWRNQEFPERWCRLVAEGGRLQMAFASSGGFRELLSLPHTMKKYTNMIHTCVIRHTCICIYSTVCTVVYTCLWNYNIYGITRHNKYVIQHPYYIAYIYIYILVIYYNQIWPTFGTFEIVDLVEHIVFCINSIEQKCSTWNSMQNASPEGALLGFTSQARGRSGVLSVTWSVSNLMLPHGGFCRPMIFSGCHDLLAFQSFSLTF